MRLQASSFLGLLPEAKPGSGAGRPFDQFASILFSHTVILAHIRTLQYPNKFGRILGV